mgnify:CR=1 FL=1
MKQAFLIATISMGALILVDVIQLIFGMVYIHAFLPLFLYIVTFAAKCGVGYFFYMMYKKQRK